jgi:hypothetical protein
MYEPDDDTHDKLAREFLEYFKANEKFAQRPSTPKRRKVRKHLASIMKLAKVRRVEIVESHREKYERERIALQQEEAKKNEK